MIKIKEINSKKDLKIFVNFPIKLYKKCFYYVPMIYQDEMNLLNENKNFYLKSSCEQALFLAYKDNKVVGRIQAILPKDSNKKYSQKRVRFTRFDCINDQEIANALLDAVKEYGLSKGMTEINGPLGYSDQEREGLLVEGFKELGTYDEQYNFPYYQKLIENYGFNKEAEWVEFKLKIDEENTVKSLKYFDRILELNKVHLVPPLPKKIFVETYKEQFFALVNECYGEIYQFSEINEAVKKQLLDSFGMFLTHENLPIMLDENDNMVGFALWMPSISKALVGSKGSLKNPITLLKLLNSVKHPKVYDFLLCGIKKEYRNKGLDIVYLKSLYDLWHKYKLDHFETNLNLKTNDNIISEWNRFLPTQNKRRFAYILEIK
ncbi:MAG: hypothetical protein MJ217_02090 [Bacilli bacterium]|nr:hypothetical protein [Bacilli bacterium]